MVIEVNGNDGKYLIKDPSKIVQFKTDNAGKNTGESVVHIIADTIENKEDRTKVSEKIFRVYS